MISFSLQAMWANKRRLMGTFLAVLLGVGFLSGTLVLGDTLRDNFNKLFSAGLEGTAVVVRPIPPKDADGEDVVQASTTLDVSLVDTIAAVDGVRAAEAEVQLYGQLIGSDGETIGGQGPPTFAGNWINDKGLNPYHIVQGRPPEAAEEVVIDRGSSKNGTLEIGDTTTILLPEPLEVTIVGIAKFGDEDSSGGVTFTGFSDAGTKLHLSKDPTKANTIRVAAEDGVSQTVLRDRVNPVIGDANEALTGKEATEQSVDDINRAFLGFLTNFLVVFAAIALLVATFSIYNTFSIVVAQRSRESALMRAIGATRRQVLTITMVEALAIGVVASVTGLVAGVGIAAGLKGVFSAFGLGLPAGGLTIRASSALIGLVVGILVTVIAAIVPAIRGTRVAPIEALRASAVEATVPSSKRAILGGVLMAVAVGLLVYAVQAKPEAELEISGFGAFLTLISMLVLGPVVARPVAGLLGGPLAKAGGVTGELARENAVRNPRRTASTAAALMVGVAVVVLFSVFIASTKNLVTQAVNRTFGGDLVISTGGFGGATLPIELAGQVAEAPGVKDAVGLSFGPMTVAGDFDFVTNADVDALSQLLDIGVSSGAASDIVGETIGISDDIAKSDKLALGDTIDVQFPDGTKADLEVAGIYDNAEIVGNYLLPRETYAAHTDSTADGIVFIALEPGANVSDVRTELKKLTEPIGKPKIQDRAEYTEAVGANLDLLLGLITVMLALAIIIAVMGIANTLALSVYERTREIGVLRAVGTTQRQIRRMVRWESVIVSTFGTVGGLGLGIALGWVLVQAAFSDSSESPFALPGGQLITAFVLGILVGVIAAARPARRAARMEVLAAVSS